MASPDLREHKHLGRGVHNVDCATWGRVREDAALTGFFSKLTQNPAMKQHLLSTGTTIFLGPALLTPCGSSVSGQTTPRLKTPLGGEEMLFSGKLFRPFATPSALK